MNKEGVGCKCGWPLDPCNPHAGSGSFRCGKAKYEETVRAEAVRTHEVERFRMGHRTEGAIEVVRSSDCKKLEAEIERLRGELGATEDVVAGASTCEDCGGSGFYEEGAEETPCIECELGRRIDRWTDTVRRETREWVLDVMREALRPETQRRDARMKERA